MKNNTLLFTLSLAFALIFLPQHLLGQRGWDEMIRDENPNFAEIENAFNEWWGDRPTTDRGYKPAKRWLEHMRGYVNENGIVDRREEVKYIQEKLRMTPPSTRAGNWSILGPINPPAQYGIGRIDCIAFHPIQPNILFAGSPSGGLWKSIDYGMNWLPMYENMPSLGVADIVINPKNPDVMYVATGDSDHFSGGPYIGILKTIDGGITWTTLLPPTTNNMQIDELVINPDNPDILHAAGTPGILRTVDGGLNWTTMVQGNYEDIDINPFNPNKLYAVGFGLRTYRHSEDGGMTWSGSVVGLREPSGGPPNDTNGRMMLTTSRADSNYIYIVAAQTAAQNNDFKALYQSTDGGNVFSVKSTQSSANLSFAQAWYDLAITASPTNKDWVFIGDSPFYQSKNAGATWERRNGQQNNISWLHVDIHDIEFHPLTNDLWVGGDGGIHKAAAGVDASFFWENRSNGLSVTQFYKLGTSVHDNNTLLAGAQDNGTMYLNKGNWERFSGGDGMECLIDYSNPNLQVSSFQNGVFQKVTNGNSTPFINSNTTGETGLWTTPFAQDPHSPRTFYAGYESLWRTTNAATWQNISGPLGASMIEVVVPRLSQGIFIYSANASRFYRSLDKGVSWETFTFVDGQGSFYDLEVVDNAPKVLYAAHQNGVFKTIDGGDTWTDISGSLPNIPVTAIVHQKGSQEGLYAGTSQGIFYKDATLADWVPFMDGLPTVGVNELEISYCAGKLRAATYGRGMWESDLYPNGANVLSNDFVIDPGTGMNDGSVMAQPAGGLSPFQYDWGNGITTPSRTGLAPGAYAVTITDYNHCRVSDTAYVGINASIDDQLTGVTDLTVYPNPVNNVLHIRIEASQQGELEFTLFNAVGQVVSQQQERFSFGESHHQLKTTSLPAGVYMLDIQQGNERVRRKVVRN